VSSSLRLKDERIARIDFEKRIIEAVAKQAEVEFPPVLVDIEIDQLLSERLRYLQQEGRSLEEYLSSRNKTEEELREDLRSLATKRVTRSLVLGKIAEEEKIEISDAEIEAEIEVMLASAAESKDELQRLLNTPRSRESIERLLMPRKTIQRLVEIAGGSATNIKIKEE
ncbi:unnamed protein product, partial [marine sediment metagenome]